MPLNRSLFNAPLSRRSFLGAAALVPGWLTLARLTPAHADSSSPTVAGERVLTATQADILNAVGDRITFTGDAAMPRFGDTAAMRTIETTLRYADADVRKQLGYLLYGFNWLPCVVTFRFARFVNLSAEEQDEYLRCWATSRFDLGRVGFQALKNLSMLGYYSQDATWGGIHYRGPWAPRPRRVASLEVEFAQERNG